MNANFPFIGLIYKNVLLSLASWRTYNFHKVTRSTLIQSKNNIISKKKKKVKTI